MSLAVQVQNPYVDGMTLTGAILQSEFSTLIAKVNDLDNDNINASANIALTKLASDEWTSWSPAWTATSVNPAIGDGTLVGRYFKVGRFVMEYIKLTYGSTSTAGTGAWIFSRALTSSARLMPGSIGYVFDASTTRQYAMMIDVASTTTILPKVILTNSTYAEYDSVSAGAPITWAVSDTLTLLNLYEAAS